MIRGAKRRKEGGGVTATTTRWTVDQERRRRKAGGILELLRHSQCAMSRLKYEDDAKWR